MKRVLLASIAAIAISAPAMAQLEGGGGAGGDFDLGIAGIAGTGSVTGGIGSASAFNSATGFSGSVSNTQAGAANPLLNSGINAAFATGSSEFGFAGVGGSSVNFGEDCGCELGIGDVGGGVDTFAGSATLGGTDSGSLSATFGQASADNVAGSAFDFSNGAAAEGVFAELEFDEFGVIGGILDAEGGFGFGVGTGAGGGIGGGGDFIPDGGIGGGGGT